MMHDENEDIWNLDEISTQWSKLDDVHVFVLRYAKPIENYLRHLLRNEDDAKEVSQSFLLKVVETGFKHADPDKGRFRYYLMRSVRNAANLFFRRQSQRRSVNVDELSPADQISADGNDNVWLDEWRTCLLDRVWKQLKHIEANRPNNFHYSVLQIAAHHQDADSTELAEKLTTEIGVTMTPTNFRKQLSRARQAFAKMMVLEVGETLESPTKEAIRAELETVQLWKLIRDYV